MAFCPGGVTKKDDWNTRKVMGKGSDKEGGSRKMRQRKVQGMGQYGELRLGSGRGGKGKVLWVAN